MSYYVYHGCAFLKFEQEFKTKKKAIAFIEAQPDADCWSFDTVKYTLDADGWAMRDERGRLIEEA